MPGSEPTTEAGRAALHTHRADCHSPGGPFEPCLFWTDILAVEAEAVEAERARLRSVVAAAIEEHFQAGRHGMSLKACGDAVVFDIFGLAPLRCSPGR